MAEPVENPDLEKGSGAGSDRSEDVSPLLEEFWKESRDKIVGGPSSSTTSDRTQVSPDVLATGPEGNLRYGPGEPVIRSGNGLGPGRSQVVNSDGSVVTNLGQDKGTVTYDPRTGTYTQTIGDKTTNLNADDVKKLEEGLKYKGLNLTLKGDATHLSPDGKTLTIFPPPGNEKGFQKIVTTFDDNRNPVKTNITGDGFTININNKPEPGKPHFTKTYDPPVEGKPREIREYSGGRTERDYVTPRGTETETQIKGRDGSITTQFNPPKEITLKEGQPPVSISALRYNPNGDPPGTEYLTRGGGRSRVDGAIEYRNLKGKDGSSTSFRSDGSRVDERKIGDVTERITTDAKQQRTSRELEFPDGKKQNFKPDGSVATTYPADKPLLLSDGTRINGIVTKDGKITDLLDAKGESLKVGDKRLVDQLSDQQRTELNAELNKPIHTEGKPPGTVREHFADGRRVTKFDKPNANGEIERTEYNPPRDGIRARSRLEGRKDGATERVERTDRKVEYRKPGAPIDDTGRTALASRIETAPKLGEAKLEPKVKLDDTGRPKEIVTGDGSLIKPKFDARSGELTELNIRSADGRTNTLIQRDSNTGRVSLRQTDKDGNPVPLKPNSDGNIIVGGIPIQVDKSGNVAGDIKVNPRGELTYTRTDAKGLNHTYTKQTDGSVTHTTEHPDKTRTGNIGAAREKLDADGKPIAGSEERFDGRAWRKSNEFKHQTNPDGTTTTTFGPPNEVKITRDTRTGADKVSIENKFVPREGHPPVDRKFEIDNKTGEMKLFENGATTPRILQFDGRTYREGTAVTDERTGDRTITFKPQPGTDGPLSAVRRKDGSIETHFAHGSTHYDPKGRLTEIKDSSGNSLYAFGYDNNGQLNRVREFGPNGSIARDHRRTGEYAGDRQSINHNTLGAGQWHIRDYTGAGPSSRVENASFNIDQSGHLARRASDNSGQSISQEFINLNSGRRVSFGPEGRVEQNADGTKITLTDKGLSAETRSGLKLTSPPLKDIAFSSNGRDLVTTERNPAGGEDITRTYSPDGRIITRQGNTITEASIPQGPGREALILKRDTSTTPPKELGQNANGDIIQRQGPEVTIAQRNGNIIKTTDVPGKPGEFKVTEATIKLPDGTYKKLDPSAGTITFDRTTGDITQDNGAYPGYKDVYKANGAHLEYKREGAGSIITRASIPRGEGQSPISLVAESSFSSWTKNANSIELDQRTGQITQTDDAGKRTIYDLTAGTSAEIAKGATTPTHVTDLRTGVPRHPEARVARAEVAPTPVEVARIPNIPDTLNSERFKALPAETQTKLRDYFQSREFKALRPNEQVALLRSLSQGDLKGAIQSLGSAMAHRFDDVKALATSGKIPEAAAALTERLRTDRSFQALAQTLKLDPNSVKVTGSIDTATRQIQFKTELSAARDTAAAPVTVARPEVVRVGRHTPPEEKTVKTEIIRPDAATGLPSAIKVGEGDNIKTYTPVYEAGKLKSLTIAGKDGTVEARIERDREGKFRLLDKDGKPITPDAQGIVRFDGIPLKVGPNGTISGELNIDRHNRLEYKTGDGPGRSIYTRNADGTIGHLSYKDWKFEKLDPSGKPIPGSEQYWDGYNWRSNEPGKPPQFKVSEDGRSVLFYDREGKTIQSQLTRDVAPETGLDRTSFKFFSPQDANKPLNERRVVREIEANWARQEQVIKVAGPPSKSATYHYDGKTYREGTATYDSATGDKRVIFAQRQGDNNGPVSAILRKDGTLETTYKHGIVKQNKEGQVTEVSTPDGKPKYKYEYDGQGRLSKVSEFDKDGKATIRERSSYGNPSEWKVKAPNGSSSTELANISVNSEGFHARSTFNKDTKALIERHFDSIASGRKFTDRDVVTTTSPPRTIYERTFVRSDGVTIKREFDKTEDRASGERGRTSEVTFKDGTKITATPDSPITFKDGKFIQQSKEAGGKVIESTYSPDGSVLRRHNNEIVGARIAGSPPIELDASKGKIIQDGAGNIYFQAHKDGQPNPKGAIEVYQANGNRITLAEGGTLKPSPQGIIHSFNGKDTVFHRTGSIINYNGDSSKPETTIDSVQIPGKDGKYQTITSNLNPIISSKLEIKVNPETGIISVNHGDWKTDYDVARGRQFEHAANGSGYAVRDSKTGRILEIRDSNNKTSWVINPDGTVAGRNGQIIRGLSADSIRFNQRDGQVTVPHPQQDRTAGKTFTDLLPDGSSINRPALGPATFITADGLKGKVERGKIVPDGSNTRISTPLPESGFASPTEVFPVRAAETRPAARPEVPDQSRHRAGPPIERLDINKILTTIESSIKSKIDDTKAQQEALKALEIIKKAIVTSADAQRFGKILGQIQPHLTSSDPRAIESARKSLIGLAGAIERWQQGRSRRRVG